MNRVRVIGGPDRAAVGQAGTVQGPEPGWDEGMVFVELDNGLEGLWWSSDLEEVQ